MEDAVIELVSDKVRAQNISKSQSDWMTLGKKLKTFFMPGISYQQEDKQQKLTCKGLDCLLTVEELKMLQENDILGQYNGEYIWQFCPYLEDDLLFFSDHYERNFAEDFVWMQHERDSGSWQLMDDISITKASTFLDLGCGAGLNAIRAAQRGAKATGIDINPRAIKIASLNSKLNGLENTQFICADWNKYDFSNFDLIVSQPPFDPVFEGSIKRYAFTGGKSYGLQFTNQLVQKFQPHQAQQKLILYVHSFIIEGRPLLTEYVDKIITRTNCYDFKLIKTYSIEKWWNKCKQRHGCSPSQLLPQEWSGFSAVGAYILSLEHRI